MTDAPQTSKTQFNVTEIPQHTAERIAREFHDTYEHLAPSFGYETRQETRAFDPQSPNGKLMIAVCARVMPLLDASLKRLDENDAEIKRLTRELHRKGRNLAYEEGLVRENASLRAALREGRHLSWGVMGIGTEKLLALKAWFSKVDSLLGTADNATAPLREPQPDDFWTCGQRDYPAYKAAHDEWKRRTEVETPTVLSTKGE